MSRKKERDLHDEELEKQQPAEETAAEDAQKPTEPVESPLSKLEKQLAEENDRYLRLMAEFDNFRKRTQKEKESIYPDAVADTVKDLLPLLDNFQRAMEAPCADEAYRKGVEIIYHSFGEALHKLGLQEYGDLGEEFDPNFHNAIGHVEDESLGENVISQVFQRGYKMGNKVIRYAIVQTAN